MDKRDIFLWVKTFLEGPDDSPGNPTTGWGVIQAEYDKWRMAHAFPCQPVGLIEESEVLSIYDENYWQPMKLDVFPWPLNVILFQMGLNVGVGQAMDLASWSFGSPATDPLQVTQATAGINIDILAHILLLRQEIYYERVCLKHPEKLKELHGWNNRVLLTAKFCGVELDNEHVEVNA